MKQKYKGLLFFFVLPLICSVEIFPAPQTIPFYFLAPSSHSMALPTILPGESEEATQNIRDLIEGPKLQRARNSHLNPKYRNPLISVIHFVLTSDNKKVLLVKKQGENAWSLLEQEAVIGEDFGETAMRSLKPWIPLKEVQKHSRIGFVSDPNRIEGHYVYSPVARTTLNKNDYTVNLLNGYEEARFFPLSELASLTIHEAHRPTVDQFKETRRVDEFEGISSQTPSPVSEKKSQATRARHKQTIQRNQTHPLISVNAIIEMDNPKEEEKGVLIAKGESTGSGSINP